MRNCPHLRQTIGKARATQSASKTTTPTAPPLVWPNNPMDHGAGSRGAQVSGRPDRLYAAIDRQNEEASNAVITCTLTVCNRLAYTLIDPGSTVSYMSHFFAIGLGKQLEQLENSFNVSNPTGNLISVPSI